VTIRPINQIARWCTQQEGATSDNVFGPETEVYRIGQKIFALVNFDSHGYVTLKADPNDALALREQHDFVRPGYYMNKRHWITVDVGPELPLDYVHELIIASYDIVFSSLTRTHRDAIASEAKAKRSAG